MDETTTPSLSDRDIETIAPSAGSAETPKPQDADGTDARTPTAPTATRPTCRTATRPTATPPTPGRGRDRRTRRGRDRHGDVVTALVELERAGSTSALERCTGDAEGFLERTWGRRAVVHHGAEPEGFGDLLTFDDVDRLLSTTSLRTPAFRLVKAGEQIPETAYTRSGTTGSRPVSGMADPRRVFERFRDGATIVLQGLHRYHEPVARFARDLELELGHACQVNAYMTPPGAQGLPLHDDPHDVFVLQAFGRKSWEVHAAPGGAASRPAARGGRERRLDLHARGDAARRVDAGDAERPPDDRRARRDVARRPRAGVGDALGRRCLARRDVPAGWHRDPRRRPPSSSDG